MNPHVADAPGLRARTRRAVQAEIGDVAMRLFLEQGFDATTMEQIARATGISRRSLFRYFSTKEDIVLGNLVESGLAVKDALEARAASEPPWEALLAAFETFVLDPQYSPERAFGIAKMLYGTPSLRASHLEKQLRWQELLVPNIAMRLGAASDDGPDPRARAIVACVLACLDVATEIWTRCDGEGDLGQIFSQAVAAVRG